MWGMRKNMLGLKRVSFLSTASVRNIFRSHKYLSSCIRGFPDVCRNACMFSYTVEFEWKLGYVDKF